MRGRWTVWPWRALILPLEAVILAYRVTLSPLVGRQCRYVPTCSVYGLEAVREHGPVRGSMLTVRRVLRCHPLAKGGYDPVPISGTNARESNRHEDKGIGAAGKCSLDSPGPAGSPDGTDAVRDAASGGAADEPTTRGQAT